MQVFKIPKRELVKMRAEHEREADRAAMARSSFSARSVLGYQPYKPTLGPKLGQCSRMHF